MEKNLSKSLINSPLVKISEAAKILGVSIDTLRRWERKGKIQPLKTPGQTRLYPLDELTKFNSYQPSNNSADTNNNSIWTIGTGHFQNLCKSGLQPQKISVTSIFLALFMLISIAVISGTITFSYLSNPQLPKHFFANQKVLGVKTEKASIFATLLSPFNDLSQAIIQTFNPQKAKELGFEKLPVKKQDEKQTLDIKTLENKVANLASAITTLESSPGTYPGNITYIDLIGKTIIDSFGNIYPANSGLAQTIKPSLGTPSNRFYGLYLHNFSVDTAGSLTASGDINVSGNTTLGSTSSNTVKIIGRLNNDLIPSGNGSQSLGDGDHYWKNGYINTITADLGGATSWSVGTLTVSSGTSFASSLLPLTTATYDIGSSSKYWRDLYLSNRLGIGSTVPAANLYVDGNAMIGYSSGGPGSLTNGLAVSGNLGIGTTSPANKLQVIGGGVIGGSYGSYSAPSNGLLVQGNVGIGATTSSNLLDVWGNSRITGTLTVDSTGTLSSGLIGYSGVTAPTSGLAISGNVGIGTTSPLAPLQIWGNNTNSAFFLNGNVGIGTTIPQALFQVNSTSSNPVVINSSGILGIGTTAPLPGLKLDVSGSARITNQLQTQYICDEKGSNCKDIRATRWSRLSGDGNVSSSVKIASDTNGGPTLADSDTLGRGDIASIGDLNGDGIEDIAVGAVSDDTGGNGRGALYILFMNTNGTVSSSVKIASGTNGGPTLADGDSFGQTVTSIGDLNGDGIEDIAVGAVSDDTGGSARGAIYILFMNTDGTVSSSVKIASGTNGGPTLADSDLFGRTVASIGDLNRDGVEDLVVGASGEDTGGSGRGAAYILFMNTDGTVASSVKIASGTNGGPTLTDGDAFGFAAANIGDLDSDGVKDLAIGVESDDTGGSGRGAFYVLFMNTDGTVASNVKIASDTNGGPTISTDNSFFGTALSSIGDLNGDGIEDIAAGEYFNDTGGTNRGAVHILFMNINGTVASSVKIASGTNGGPTLADSDSFGRGVASIGDLNGDGIVDLAVGAYGDDTGGNSRGAVHILFMAKNNIYFSGQNVGIGVTTPGSSLSVSGNGIFGFGGATSIVGPANGLGISGNLGIGTTSPNNKLQVIGAGVFGADYAQYSAPANGLLVQGNVGLGSTGAVGYGLDVWGTGRLTGTLTVGSLTSLGNILPSADDAFDLGSNTARWRDIYLGPGSVHIGTSTSDEYAVSYDTSNNSLGFNINGSGPSEITFDSLGNVGIGTSVPHAKLSIQGNVGIGYTGVNQAIPVNGLAVFGNIGIGITTANSNLSISGNAHIGSIRQGVSAPTNGLFVDGNVGIGATTSSNILDIWGNSRISGTLTVDSTGTLGSGLIGYSGVTAPTSGLAIAGNLGIGTTSPLAPLQIWGNNTNSAFFLNGNVGIGTTIPQALFQVNSASSNPVVITSSGILGIGTTAPLPGLKLDVSGSARITEQLRTQYICDEKGSNCKDIRATRWSRLSGDGNVSSTTKIASSTNGGPTLADTDKFGGSIASIGDLNGDGVEDLAVGAWVDDTGGSNRGATYVLFMKTDGTVSSTVKIASGTNGGPTLSDSDYFGYSVASIGDLNGDGVNDLAVGAYGDDTGGNARGTTYVLFMKTDGTVSSTVKIASGTNGGPTLADSDQFGYSIASIGDLNGDGVEDLAVGAIGDDTGGSTRGATYVLFMKTDGTVSSTVKIASGTNGGPTLSDSDYFGYSVASVGDLNGDGMPDLAVGASGDDTGGTGRGAAYILFMNTNGTVSSSVKIASGTNGGPTLANSDQFGISAAGIGDLNGDGINDLAVGATGDDTGGSARGATYVLFMKTDGTVSSTVKIASGTNGGPTLADGDVFGTSVSAIGDLNGDGIEDLAVGATGDDTGASGAGALHILFMAKNNIYFSGQNVGIGVTTPGSSLSVSGNGIFGFGGATSIVGPTNGLGISGNLGIGTTSPNNKLQVVGGGVFGTDYGQYSAPTNGLLVQGNVGLGSTGAVNYGLDVWGTGRVTGALTVGGNVGIGGTATFNSLVSVSGNIIPSANNTYDLGSDSSRWRDLYLGPNTLHLGTSISDEYTMAYDTSNNSLGFNINGSGPSEITFDSLGNVGIGTSTPQAKLSIQGNVGIGYSGANQAIPVNGLAVFGNVGIGTTTANSNLSISGNAHIGSIWQGATAPTDGLFVDGNVGIGATTSSNKLDVWGNARIAGTLSLDSNFTLGGGQFLANNGTASLPNYSFTNLTNAGLWTNGDGLLLTTGETSTKGITVTGAGFVGIGTTNPSTKLHLDAPNNNDPVELRITGRGVSPTIRTQISEGSQASPSIISSTGGSTLLQLQGEGYDGSSFLTAAQIIMQSEGTVASTRMPGRMIFSTATNAAPSVLTERMRIDSSGNLGIGISAPDRLLQVASTIDITSSMAGLMGVGGTQFDISGATTNAAKKLVLGVDTTDNYGIIQAGNTDGTAYNLALQPGGGNVGIGITSPLTSLHISQATGAIKVVSTTGTNFAYAIFNNNAGDMQIGRENSTGGGLVTGSSAYAGVLSVGSAHSLQLGTNNAIRMTIDSTGNVGLGTVSPVAQLDVRNTNTSTGLHAYIGSSAGQFSILDNGNVGIGTTSPTYTLDLNKSVTGGNVIAAIRNLDNTHVSSTARLVIQSGGPSGGDAYVHMTIADTDTEWALGIDNSDSDKFKIATNGDLNVSNVLTIDNSGNVGLGTSSPLSRLSVAGGAHIGGTYQGISAPTDGLFVDGNVGIGATTSSNKLDVWGNARIAGTGVFDSTLTALNGLIGYSGITAPTNGLAISGNVGIGFTSPSAKLEVVGDVFIRGTSSNLQIENNNALQWNQAGTSSFWDVIKIQSDDSLAIRGINNQPTHIVAGSMAPVVTFLNDGNTGIGTTSPIAKLGVAGNVGIGMSYGWYSAPANGMIVEGNVGIGASTPNYNLDIWGTTRSTSLSGTGNRAVYSDADGQLTNSASDIRLKTNIQTISDRIDVLGALDKLRGVYFNWNIDIEGARHFGTKEELGMIAQEVETVLPDLVGMNADGYKSLNYAQMTGFLVEVGKAQQLEISSLKSQMLDLQNKQASSSAQTSDVLGLNTVLEGTPSASINTFSSVKILENLDTNSLTTIDATISGTLKALGDTFLGNTIIAGNLTVDGTTSITGDSISTIGTLNLQNGPLAEAVDFFNGKVTIDKSGKITAETVKAAQFEGVSGKSVGGGTIPAGSKSIDIPNSLVKAKSRILLTPTSDTDQVLRVTNKIEGTKFTVSVSSPPLTDITFDWWLINEE